MLLFPINKYREHYRRGGKIAKLMMAEMTTNDHCEHYRNGGELTFGGEPYNPTDEDRQAHAAAVRQVLAAAARPRISEEIHQRYHSGAAIPDECVATLADVDHRIRFENGFDVPHASGWRPTDENFSFRYTNGHDVHTREVREKQFGIYWRPTDDEHRDRYIAGHPIYKEFKYEWIPTLEDETERARNMAAGGR